LAIPNPIDTSSLNYLASSNSASYLVSALQGDLDFSSIDHLNHVHAARLEHKIGLKELYESNLQSRLSELPYCEKRTILRGRLCGQWLSSYPSRKNGTELSASEFRDNLLLRYSRQISNLPKTCDGCGVKFSVRHALTCKAGGLIISRHNEIRNELIDLATKALTPTAVRVEPLIDPTSLQPDDLAINDGKRGDLLIRGCWSNGTHCIIDVRITDTDADSNRRRDPLKILEEHEREKKKKYLAYCIQQRRHFTPFVVSTDGLIGREGKTLLRKLSSLLAEKSGKSYSTVCGYVNSRMSIAIARATHLSLRGSRIPTSKMSVRLPQWEDCAGMNLFRH
jgi:hypothetical protein